MNETVVVPLISPDALTIVVPRRPNVPRVARTLPGSSMVYNEINASDVGTPVRTTLMDVVKDCPASRMPLVTSSVTSPYNHVHRSIERIYACPIPNLPNISLYFTCAVIM